MKKDRRRRAAKSSLASLFPSMAMARLVVFFAVHPGGRYHVRELSRTTRLSSASLQHELRRLAEMGALRREDEGSRAYYRADESHPSWRAWVLLLRSSARPADVLREALVDAPGLDAAFVFGSSARGDARADSDVDVFLVGTDEARAAAGRRLSEAELLVGRALDVIGYEPEELAARIRSGNAFIRRVLAEPREWVRGDLELAGLPEAA
ncbi:MAG TPA: nucleotidyltransferase domain-containing protein [Longimicrobium sp.]|nr:nucleotidyltransferase domain-containing protein [Longimicrobium sp.]